MINVYYELYVNSEHIDAKLIVFFGIYTKMWLAIIVYYIPSTQCNLYISTLIGQQRLGLKVRVCDRCIGVLRWVVKLVRVCGQMGLYPA